MKQLITLVSLVGLAALNSACAEETGSAKQATGTATEETATVAMNSGAAATATSPKSTGSAARRETGTTRTAVDLKATPHSDAKGAGQLAANTTVDILERRGGWLRISASGKTGWAKLHQVRAGEGPEAKKSGEGLAILKNVGQTGRSGSQGIVATTGIRGMSAEELKNAKPDPAAVKTVEGYRVNASQAREYAKAVGLKENSVPALPKPE
ncbi:MAG: hypothetical protein Tsb0026_16060 [Sulfuricaulis sp.]